MTSFASDNYAGVHPDVLRAIAEANVGHASAYGADPWTARLEQRVRDEFGEDARVYCVFNGTAANVLGLQALLRPWQAVICAASAHVNTDECGAPERILGSKLLAAHTDDGKLTPAIVERLAGGVGDEHRVQPAVVSITQSTELGTLYTAEEVLAVAEHAHDLGLHVHMDGARLANAAAALGLGLREASRDLGVDVLALGATKNGALGGEAVVLFRPELAEGFQFWRKQTMQLASKMRFVAVQLEALLTDDLWRRNAEHSNGMAARLEGAVRGLPGVRITRPAQANAVFAVLPRAATALLQPEWPFYVWDETTGEVRWMCSWDTTAGEVDAFAEAVQAALVAAAAAPQPAAGPGG